ncbi:hypothetical protein OSB04_017220 [Centaurea solstitialis]|uniref:SWIM-type domain-containing protein n=1 Tax=Centaurea solstitialis TaxID=347529 RepID=A0AA38WI61_9ASTR|nr:hypothetical protein OSB04_017220 [Centaurea solstitialis]
MVRTSWLLRSNHDETTMFEVYDMYPAMVALKIYHGGVFSPRPDEFSVFELNAMMKEIEYTDDDVATFYHFKIPASDLHFGFRALGNDMDVLNFLRVETYLSSPGMSKVVIEEVPTQEGSPELNRSKKKVGQSSSCKRRLMIGWDEPKEPSRVNEVGNGGMMDTTTVVVEPEGALNEGVALNDSDFADFFNDTAATFNEQQQYEVGDDDAEGDDHAEGEVSDYELKDDNGMVEVEVEMGDFDDHVGGIHHDVLDNDMEDYQNDMEERVNYLKKLKAERVSKAKDSGINFYVGQNDASRIKAVCLGTIPEIGGPSKVTKRMVRKKGVCGPGQSNPIVGEPNKTKKWAKPIPDCPWVLHISKGVNKHSWMVKTYVDTHKCLQTREMRACTATFLSQEIEETLMANPEIPIKNLQVTLEQKYENNISHMKSFRAKQIAMKKLMGDYGQQYIVLRDYICELLRTNPGTTVKLDVVTDGQLNNDTRQFKRIYVCLGALKKGFAAGKMDLLGLDGAFMKGPFPGQILTTVGIDSNNGTYPLAYGIFEAETIQSWSWFLGCLGDDLDLSSNSNFTFMSDRQKGIIPAIARIFPCAEHRHCVRHIQQNMKQRWKGKVYSDYLWKRVLSSTVEEFTANMEELKQFDVGAYNWLKQINPKHWTKSHFTGRCHSDVLLSNMCETFNNQLVDGRIKPIITKVIDKGDGILTPTATDRLKDIKTEAAKLHVLWNGDNEFQVSGTHRDQCVVDMRLKTCACRRWELTGIPCKHVVAAIWNMAVNGLDNGIVENWVHPVYWLQTWKAMYSFKISPINGRALWPKSGCPTTITAPKHHVQVGRPKKKRKKSVDEVFEAAAKGTKEKLRKIGKSVTCGKCKHKGHNSRSCKGQ